MLLIKNGYIKPMVGPDLENGCVLIDDNGKIAAVGMDLEAPAGALVIDAEGRLVTPGCVDAHCHIGLDNEGMGWEGMDYNEITDPVTHGRGFWPGSAGWCHFCLHRPRQRQCAGRYLCCHEAPRQAG